MNDDDARAVNFGTDGAAAAPPASALGAMALHTVFCAECTTYFDWKSAGVFWSHRAVGMPGPITRLLACSPAQQLEYPARSMAMGRTFVHPNFADNPRTNETSGSYNKPASVMFWIREARPVEEYVLFIDADMLLRAPLDPLALGAKRGVVVSEHVDYLDVGIRAGLPTQFIAAGAARGARAAGWWHVFHRDDLATIAPRWLHWCERLRAEPWKYWRTLDGEGRPLRGEREAPHGGEWESKDIATGARVPYTRGRGGV